jgi:hypothetical protein
MSRGGALVQTAPRRGIAIHHSVVRRLRGRVAPHGFIARGFAPHILHREGFHRPGINWGHFFNRALDFGSRAYEHLHHRHHHHPGIYNPVLPYMPPLDLDDQDQDEPDTTQANNAATVPGGPNNTSHDAADAEDHSHEGVSGYWENRWERRPRRGELRWNPHHNRFEWR